MRYATVADSPWLPPTEEPVPFLITARGIGDIEEKPGRGVREEGQGPPQEAPSEAA